MKRGESFNYSVTVTVFHLKYYSCSVTVIVFQLRSYSYSVSLTLLQLHFYCYNTTVTVFHLQYYTYSITVTVLQLQCHSYISYNVTFIVLQKVLQYYFVGRVIVSSFMRVQKEQEGERIVLLARPLEGGVDYQWPNTPLFGDYGLLGTTRYH